MSTTKLKSSGSKSWTSAKGSGNGSGSGRNKLGSSDSANVIRSKSVTYSTNTKESSRDRDAQAAAIKRSPSDGYQKKKKKSTSVLSMLDPSLKDLTLDSLKDEVLFQSLMDLWLCREGEDSEEGLALSLALHLEARNRFLEFAAWAIQLELSSCDSKVVWREDSLVSRMIIEQTKRLFQEAEVEEGNSSEEEDSSRCHCCKGRDSFLDTIFHEAISDTTAQSSSSNAEALAHNILRRLSLTPRFPNRVRNLFSVIYRCSEYLHPGRGNQSLGNFFFLRFLCPFLISKTQSWPSSSSLTLRDLVQCAKLLQVLASCNSDVSSEITEFQRVNQELLVAIYDQLATDSGSVSWSSASSPFDNSRLLIQATETLKSPISLESCTRRKQKEILMTFFPVANCVQRRHFALKKKIAGRLEQMTNSENLLEKRKKRYSDLLADIIALGKFIERTYDVAMESDSTDSEEALDLLHHSSSEPCLFKPITTRMPSLEENTTSRDFKSHKIELRQKSLPDFSVIEQFGQPALRRNQVVELSVEELRDWLLSEAEEKVEPSTVELLTSLGIDGKRFVTEFSDHTTLINIGVKSLRERKSIMKLARAATAPDLLNPN